MQTIKRYFVSANPPHLVEMTPAYQRDTGFHGLVKGEDYDALVLELGHSAHREALKLEQSHQREAALQEMLNKAEDLADRPTLQKAAWDLKARNNRLFRWSCLGYLLALGCLTYIFATRSI